MSDKKPTFEDCYEIIDTEIAKRKGKWTLTAINWFDWDDIAQIIRLYIWKQWHMYDSAKPLGPWLNVVITNQIRNLIKNNYTNFSRPCLKCEAARDNDECEIYGKQCEDCPLYARWKKHKESALNIKLPVSMENHTQEVSDIPDDAYDIERHGKVLHEKMREILKPVEWKIYQYLYVEHLSDEEITKKMGYISNEKGRIAGYKQLRNIRKSIIDKVKKVVYSEDIDI